MSAGKYICRFEAQGFRWELHQVVRVPLQATDVTGLPDQLSVSCAASPGFQLSCCTPSAHLGYTASWSPREGGQGMERGRLSRGSREKGQLVASRQLGLQLPGNRLQFNLGVPGPILELQNNTVLTPGLFNNNHMCLDNFHIMLSSTRSPRTHPMLLCKLPLMMVPFYK